MAITLGANFGIAAPNPIDDRYLSTRLLSGKQLPYSADTEVYTTVSLSRRYTGLTVNVNGKEWWFKDDLDTLVEKTMGGGTLTGATDGIHLVNSGTSVALGGDLNGDVYFSGGTLRYVTSPMFTGDTQIVDKLYVDTVAAGLQPKTAAWVATTVSDGNLDLSGVETIDGVTTTDGMRVLVKNQTSGATNGIYIASASTWTRATDFDGSPDGEIAQGALIPIISGSSNHNSLWVLVTPDPITVDVTPLNFTLFSKVTDLIAGQGLQITGTTIKINDPTYAHITAALTGATNGLGYVGKNVCLGGNLIEDTIIGTDNNSIYIGNISGGGLYISSGLTLATYLGSCSYLYTNDAFNNTLGTVIICADNGGVDSALTQVGTHNTGFTSAYAESVVYASSGTAWSGHDLEIDCFEIYSCNNPLFAGAIYDCNYTSKFTCLSIPHVGYVTGLTSTSGIQTASNGLTKVGTNVCLGGALNSTTTISLTGNPFQICGSAVRMFRILDSNNRIELTTASGPYVLLNPVTNTDHMSIGTNAGSSVCLKDTCVTITGGGGVMEIVDAASKGFVYNGDYESNFTARSLVTKQYVTGYTQSMSNIVNVNNVCTSYTTTSTDNFVGVSGTSCIYLLNSPVLGQRVSIADICGNALSDPIEVNGNGYNIVDGACSLINTNYGSMTFVFNGYFWSAISYIL